MSANQQTSLCITIPFQYSSCLADNPPKDSSLRNERGLPYSRSPNRKRKIIIVVALGLWIILTFFGIAWWKGYLGSRLSREEGDVLKYSHI